MIKFFFINWKKQLKRLSPNMNSIKIPDEKNKKTEEVSNLISVFER